MLIPYAALAGLATCAPEPQASGAKLYAQNCAACHGVDGQGDGPQAGDLPVPPPDLTGIAAANGGVFPTADVMADIYGYRGKHIAGLMPEFSPVLDSPTVMWRSPDGEEIPTPSALVELAEYIERLQQD